MKIALSNNLLSGGEGLSLIVYWRSFFQANHQKRPAEADLLVIPTGLEPVTLCLEGTISRGFSFIIFYISL